MGNKTRQTTDVSTKTPMTSLGRGVIPVALPTPWLARKGKQVEPWGRCGVWEHDTPPRQRADLREHEGRRAAMAAVGVECGSVAALLRC